jgi:hypothetical protein
LAVVTLALLALMAFALPASAAKPSKPGGGSGGSTNTSTSMVLGHSAWVTNNTCAFDATYTWSGVKGKSYELAVQLLDSSGAVLATAPTVGSLPAGGSFTFIFSFNGAPGPQRNISARGVLVSGGAQVSGTAAISSLVPTTCGNPISIGWVSTIVLT